LEVMHFATRRRHCGRQRTVARPGRVGWGTWRGVLCESPIFRVGACSRIPDCCRIAGALNPDCAGTRGRDEAGAARRGRFREAVESAAHVGRSPCRMSNPTASV